MLMSLDLILAFLELCYDSLAQWGGSGSYPEHNILLSNQLQIYFKYETGIWSSRTNKPPRALPLLDAQQPAALGKVFKSLLVSSLTNACWRNTQKQNEVSERKSGGWRDGWMLLGTAEMELQRAVVCVEFYQQRSPWTLLSRSNIQIQPAWIPLLSPSSCFPVPRGPVNTWFKGPKQWPKEKLGESPDTASLKKKRQ